MRIHYTCSCCGEAIDSIDVDEVDEKKFGFDCLNEEERRHLLRVDKLANAMYVQSLCDSCIEVMNLADEAVVIAANKWVH